METKVCSKCKQERRINLFKADRASSSGLRTSCKMCDSDAYRAKKAQNPEVFEKYRANFRARNPEYMSMYMKDYYQLHKI